MRALIWGQRGSFLALSPDRGGGRMRGKRKGGMEDRGEVDDRGRAERRTCDGDGKVYAIYKDPETGKSASDRR